MTMQMLINAVEPEEFRVAVIKDGLLDGFHIETSTSEQRIGNIYKGVVARLGPSLQACFVNFGADKNGFLQAGDIHPEYYQVSLDPEKVRGAPPIDKIVRKGQELLVQVTKEMPGRKGAQLTTYLSLASRYLVLTPGKPTAGVSKKIEDETERVRLKEIMSGLKIPPEIGYIVRTAAQNQSKKTLSRDLNRLLRMWNNIKKRAKKAPPLSIVHQEQDVCLRTLRDYFTGEFSEVVVDDKDVFGQVKDYMKIISPRHQRRVKLYKGERPIFDVYDVERQIEAIYKNTVPLKSGGSIVIDSTEALISVDVNSGRGRGQKDVETTAFNTNLEAAVEIARQLRLRDIGGLVVIDFIDMKDRKHIKEVEKAFREETRNDRAKIDVSPISKFGLLELSRQRLRPSLESRSYQECPHCRGRGLIPSIESSSLSQLRQIWMGLSKGGVAMVEGRLPLEVATYLQNRKRKELADLESRFDVSIVLEADPSLPPGEGSLNFIKKRKSGSS